MTKALNWPIIGPVLSIAVCIVVGATFIGLSVAVQVYGAMFHRQS